MSRKLKVLLAEDDAALSRYFQSLLNQWGCEIAVEQTGEGAVRRAVGFKPDVALLGFITPGVNGAKAGISLLQVSPRTRIVLTVEFVPAAILSGLRAQGYDFWTLAAPFESEELRTLCFPLSPQTAEEA